MKNTIAIACAVFTVSPTLAGEGVQSDYYLTGADRMVYVVRGTKVVNSFPTVNPDRGSVYVYDDVVCTVDDQTIFGGFYSLDGTPTGETFTNPSPGIPIISDAATDGVYAYGFSVLAQDLMRHDMDFSNREPLLTLSAAIDRFRYSSVAYDPEDSNFWLGGNSVARIDKYDSDENVVDSFPIAVSNTRCLAYDPADETLWFTVGGTNTLYQYSRSGELLNILIPEGLPNIQFDGGDFNLAPAPTCSADFNGDGVLNFFDISAFINAFNSGCE